MPSRSTLRAVLIAPLATVPCVAFSLAVLPGSYYGLTESRTLSEYLAGVLMLCAFAIPIALAAVILLGLPLRLLFRRMGASTSSAYIVVAVAISSLVFWRLSGGFSLLWQLLAISCSLSVALLFAYIIGDLSD